MASAGRSGWNRARVASFYSEVTETLEALGVNLTLFGRPVEVPISIPFAQDDQHRSYDAAAAQAFWLALLQAHRVMAIFRGRFIGKASPVHFFWGAADLATSRFSGRRAPQHHGGVPELSPTGYNNWLIAMKSAVVGSGRAGPQKGRFTLTRTLNQTASTSGPSARSGFLRQKPGRVHLALRRRARR